MSIEQADKEAAAVQKGQRVSLADIEAFIVERHDLNLGRVLAQSAGINTVGHPSRVFSLCILVLKNGYIVTGESASADPENFNQEVGTKFAYEAALRKVWPLMGFALASKVRSVG